MAEEALDVAEELRRLVVEKQVPWGALSAVTGISVDVLRAFAEDPPAGLGRAALEPPVLPGLVGVAEGQIREFLADPSNVSAASKYELAVRLSYLVNAIILSAPR